MSGKLNLDDSRRHLAHASAAANDIERVGWIMSSLGTLLSSLSTLEQQPEPATDADKTCFALTNELAEVRRQHQQTIEERDKLAKRVTELECAARLMLTALGTIDLSSHTCPPDLVASREKWRELERVLLKTKFQSSALASEATA